VVRPHLLASLALCALTWCNVAHAQNAPKIRLDPVVQGLSQPGHLWHDGKRMFVVEQAGRIRLLADGKVQAQPYLDIVKNVKSGGECGLLSVAFSPKFRENGLFYVNYTRQQGKLQTVIAEFQADPQAAAASADKERVILTIDQPFANHNGGHILFGPDGMLYIGMGDGGAADDPFGNAQNPKSLLGKILRIDVTPRDKYAVPKDNPFVDDPRLAREVWALGMRNPWRMCFDPQTGTMIVGDVGQNIWEEVTLVKAATNGGWRAREGMHPNPNIPREDPISADTDPIVEYQHRTYARAGTDQRAVDNCIIGGFVYRGSQAPSLSGWYLYADNASGRIWGMLQQRGKLISNELLLEPRIHPSSFGEDPDGEMYVVDYGGAILKIATE
jgi:glucose/arabinose dehydrogenase